jgi:serine/threonine protein kinase
MIDKIDIMYQILTGLLTLHRSKYLHLDLNPNNIILYNEDNKIRAVITDFGYSRTFQSSKSSTFGGTFPYNPPWNRDKITNNSTANDIWALGLIYISILLEKFDCDIKIDDNVDILYRPQKVRKLVSTILNNIDDIDKLSSIISSCLSGKVELDTIITLFDEKVNYKLNYNSRELIEITVDHLNTILLITNYLYNTGFERNANIILLAADIYFRLKIEHDNNFLKACIQIAIDFLVGNIKIERLESLLFFQMKVLTYLRGYICRNDLFDTLFEDEEIKLELCLKDLKNRYITLNKTINLIADNKISLLRYWIF